MRYWLLVVVGGIGLVMGGCFERDRGVGDVAVEEAGAGGVVSEIVEPMTGAGLRVEVASREVDLTDVVRVRVVMSWDEGVEVELIEPGWEEAGWSGVSEQWGEIRFDGVRFERDVVFGLEPFLGGEYAVPSIGIRAESDAVGRRIARLEPIGVLVRSVVETGDDGVLDPAIGLVGMPEDERTRAMGWWIVGGAGVAAVCGVVIAWTRRRSFGGDEMGIDPEAVLMVVANAEELSEDDVGALHRAVVALSGEHGALHTVTDEIERVRFAGGGFDHRRIKTAARRAMVICGLDGVHERGRGS